ncbi:MAG: HAMP domain-containing histidine kinase [Clostridiales bacterium]|nr:HAMP domain-containing histidine kinase [Clostridiales bacterium]
MAASGKRRRRSISLYRRILSYFIAIEIVCLTVFGCVLMYFVAGDWSDEQKKALLDCAVGISDRYENILKQDGTSYSALCYSLLSVSNTTDADIFITDTEGNVILCGEMAETVDTEENPQVCDTHKAMKIPGEIYTSVLADGTMATVGDFGGLLGEDCFVSASVAQKDGEAYGIVFAIQSSRVGLRPYLVRFFRIYFLSAMGLLVLTSLLVYVASYNITKPLREMVEATKRYAKGDFSYKINVNNKSRTVSEFYELSVELDSMAEDLEALENSRSNFVANVSHELKTPMTTISGFVDGILDGTIDKEHENQYLKIVSEEVKRLSRLISSMLNMSKMEAGQLKINPVKFNLTQMILGIFISFEQKIEAKSITVKGLDYLLSVYIEGDEDMISQVFYNLIDNAVKFTDEDGEISVDMSTDGEYITTSIRNTGKGIDEEDMSHVFERFYKGDKSRSLDTKSVGLGLFIVKNITELHNGEISVNSVSGKYTEFTVKLKVKLIGS